MPEQGKIRLLRAVERLVQLNEATGKKDEAARWRKELEAIKAVSNKAEEKPPIAPVSHEARVPFHGNDRIRVERENDAGFRKVDEL